MTGCRPTVRRYEQLETSPETIEQELRPAVCERRQTDRLKDNFSICDSDCNKEDNLSSRSLHAGKCYHCADRLLVLCGWFYQEILVSGLLCNYIGGCVWMIVYVNQ